MSKRTGWMRLASLAVLVVTAACSSATESDSTAQPAPGRNQEESTSDDEPAGNTTEPKSDTGTIDLGQPGDEPSDDPTVEPEPVSSVLRRSAQNPNYFFNADGPILLTGSHTWTVLQDRGPTDPPVSFDYVRFLDFLVEHHHNFFRLWSWEQAKWSPGRDYDFWLSPLPYARTGADVALDGKPKFDLTSYDEDYFERLRERVASASDRGIYVAVMLFNGWSIETKGLDGNNPWDGHPYNLANNINGIDGDPEKSENGLATHRLEIDEVTELQEGYVRRVIDTVNEFDNVLFEVSNESRADSLEWQRHIMNVIREYESSMPKQHPVGITVPHPDGDNYAIAATDADWISPSGRLDSLDFETNDKVVLLDTDHLCGICGSSEWVWKAFLSGYNPIFMDPYSDETQSPDSAPDDPTWVALRVNIGRVARIAEQIDLANAIPRGDLSSSGYALAARSSGSVSFVVLSTSDELRVDLSSVNGDLHAEWLQIDSGETARVDGVPGGDEIKLQSPFSGASVLLLWQ